MSLGDLLDFRLTCRGFNDMVKCNQSSIVISLVKREPLRKTSILYRPLVTSGALDLDFLLGLSHRFYVVEHIATFLAKFHLIQAHRLTPPSLVEEPENLAIVNNMIRRMRPYLLMLYHFIEMYRVGLAEAVTASQHLADRTYENPNHRVEAQIIRQYNGRVIHRLCAMSRFLIKIIVRRLRPASYAGRFERLLRGWSRDPASETQCMELLIIGSLEAVNKTITLSGFPARIAAIERYLQEFSSVKNLSRQSSRNMSIVSWKSKTSSDAPDFSSTVMQPLGTETISKVSQILPESDDFLKIDRLASLFEPGVVLVDQVQTPWNFAQSLMGDEIEEDFDFVASVSGAGSSPTIDDVQIASNFELQEGALSHPFTWPSFSGSYSDASEFDMSNNGNG